ncbi:MAG: hypothetical protein JSR14_10650 [Proteobacteria bacterium]|nr:hypothetical protein [Pseudomonadota bacterium]
MAFAENKHKFVDFTQGESEHKIMFTTGHRQCADVFCIRRSFAHWWLAQNHRNFNTAMKKSYAFFERLHMQARTRQRPRFGR